MSKVPIKKSISPVKSGDISLNKSTKLIALVFSDLHINDYSKFSTRLNTSLNILEYISDICIKHNIPAIHCGDLFHKPDNISQVLMKKVFNTFRKLDSNNWDLYTISGNHTINEVSKIGKIPLSWENILSEQFNFLHSIDYTYFDIDNIRFYGIPYVDHNIGLGKYLKELELDDNRYNVLLLHTDYPGAKDTDGSEVGTSENISQNNLDKFDLILMGHIHLPQRLSKKIYMIGSPYQQRRTDKKAKLGYWELYSDLSLKFVSISDRFPRFIDVKSDQDILDDGNYYTVISEKIPQVNLDKSPNNLNKSLSKKRLVKRYLKEKGILDKKREGILLDIIKESEDD